MLNKNFNIIQLLKISRQLIIELNCFLAIKLRSLLKPPRVFHSRSDFILFLSLIIVIEKWFTTFFHVLLFPPLSVLFLFCHFSSVPLFELHLDHPHFRGHILFTKLSLSVVIYDANVGCIDSPTYCKRSVSL